MSEKISRVFKDNRKVFFSREGELEAFLNKYWVGFFDKYRLEEVTREDETVRIPITGYYEELSGWRVREIITICSHEVVKGTQTRYDYKFIFEGYVPGATVAKVTVKEKAVVVEEKKEVKIPEDKPYKEWTDEEKEAYKQKKEEEKKEVEETFDKFLEKQTVKDVVELIESTKDKQLPPPEVIEVEPEDEILKERVDKVKELKQIHGYSVRNYLLVLAQARNRKDEKFQGVINSYWNWKRQSAQVLRNPDKSKPYSYKILVPVMKNNVLQGFKLGNVFDISQTNKASEYLENRQVIESNIEKIPEIEYNEAINFIKGTYPDITLDEDGDYLSEVVNYDAENQSIILKKKSSHEAFHGLGYHIIRDLELISEGEKAEDRNEMLAEITCYLLMKKFETESKYKVNFDFGYSYCWALEILEIFKFGEFEKAYNTITDHVKLL